MDTTYLVEFEAGDVRFKVQSSDKAWANEQLERMLELARQQSPAATTDTPPSEDYQPAIINQPSAEPQLPDDITNSSPLKVIWNEAIGHDLRQYIAQRQLTFARSTAKQAAILATFMEDELGIEAVTPADLELIYRKLDLATISHEAQLKNATIRDKFFTANDGSWRLSHAGRVFGRDTSRQT